jgi:hypothetical protein
MPAGRRQPPPCPQGAPPPPAHVWKLLLQLWAWVVNSHFGMPAPHADLHIATGSDPLPAPGTPEPVSLTETSAGSGPAYAYEDHQHALDPAVIEAIEDAETLAWIL